MNRPLLSLADTRFLHFQTVKPPESKMMACSKMTMNRLFAVVLAALSVTAFGQQAPGPQRVFAPEGTPITLGLAGYAKVLCSAVVVSGREPAEAFRNSGFFLFPDEHRAGVTYAVDRDRKLVRM